MSEQTESQRNEYQEYLDRVATVQSDPAEDDGSLAFLELGTDREHKTFSCPAKRQGELIGKTFWIVDYFADVKGYDSKMKYLYKAKWNLNDPEEMAFKVWTGSQDCCNVLDKLAELGKFPRKVTLMNKPNNRGGMYFK